jgi:hypothetical protein
VLSRPAQTAPAESEERPFIIQSNVSSTHSQTSLVQHGLCPFEAAHAGGGKWPENFRKKTQGGPELAAEQITKVLFQRKPR